MNTDEPRALDCKEVLKSDGQVVSLYSPDPYRYSDHDLVLAEMVTRGDLINNGKLELADSLVARRALLSRVGSPRYVPEADCNDDGRVTQAEWIIWLKILNERRSGVVPAWHSEARPGLFLGEPAS